MLTASPWPTNTGTRTQVAVSLIFGSRIFLVSTVIFHSSRVYAVVLERVDMGNAVEGDLLGELLRRRRVGDEDALGLVPQLIHGILAGAGHRLVGRHDHAAYARRVVQRLQRHDELGGGAIGIGDDVAPAARAP